MITVRAIEQIGGIYRTVVIARRKGERGCLYIIKASTKEEVTEAVEKLCTKLRKQGKHL